MTTEQARRIFVASEFAPLRTVVVAQCQMRLPDADSLPDAQLAEEMSILPPGEREIVRGLLGKDHADVLPERQQKWEAERQALRAVFENMACGS